MQNRGCEYAAIPFSLASPLDRMNPSGIKITTLVDEVQNCKRSQARDSGEKRSTCITPPAPLDHLPKPRTLNI